MIRICVCGHLESDHGTWNSDLHETFSKACLVPLTGEVDELFACVNCFEFKLDNLRSLEITYNDKPKPIF